MCVCVCVENDLYILCIIIIHAKFTAFIFLFLGGGTQETLYKVENYGTHLTLLLLLLFGNMLLCFFVIIYLLYLSFVCVTLSGIDIHAMLVIF